MKPTRNRRPRAAVFFLIAACPLLAAENRVTIRETAAAAGQPFTISRVFAEGEIHGYPKPRIEGAAPDVWQADVMTRWKDGSVQHALVSFAADDKARKTLAVDFVDDAHPCSAGDRKACDAAALTQEQMLAFAAPAGWGAAIETTVAGRKHVVAAREMLAAGAWRYWLRGPAVTQVIVEDQSAKLAYDWGYRDRRILVLSHELEASATAADVSDAADLRALALPQQVRIDAEEVTVCAVNGNRLTFGKSACPARDGRGVNGTAAAAHLFGAVGQILSVARPDGWRERVLGYTRAFDSAAAVAGMSTPEFVAALPHPAEVRVGAELLAICKINPGLDGALVFGTDAQHCPDKHGRGAEHTAAAAHSDFSPVFSPQWSSDWVEAADANHKSLHPIFVLSFYRNWPGVKVEYIVENTWTTKLQDQFYELSLKSGREGQQERFRDAFNHRAMTRWRKTFWDGAQPPAAHIDYNLAYLTQSRALPNYDLTKHVSRKAIADEAARFQAGDRGELNGHGEWLEAMPTAGGRPDIGLFARWYVRYLYTFDPDLYAVMLGNGAVSGYVPVHLRESLSGRPYHGKAAGDAFGRTVSVDARPTLVTRGFDFSGAGDLIVPVGMTVSLPRTGTARKIDGWNVDEAHQPDMPYIPYLITGDWYFLQELYFWGAYDTAYATQGVCEWCRHDDWGFISESAAEPRGLAWALRNLAHAAWFAPDGSAEKAYFTEKLNNNFAIREGIAGITNGAFYDPAPGSKWSWGRNVVASRLPDPLRWDMRALGAGGDAKAEGGCYTLAPWMENYRQIVLGHVEELGFTGVTPLRRWFAVNLLHQIADPAYMPKTLIGAYYVPTRDSASPCTASAPLADWGDVARRVPAAEIAASQKRWDIGGLEAEHNYPVIAFGAASFLPGIRDGALRGEDAWNWMKAHVNGQDALNDNPKWALVPRAPK